MQRVNFICDHCRGPVWSDIVSANYVDMSCIYCGKRYFVKRAKYEALIKRLEKSYAGKVTRAKKLLQEQRANLQGN